MNLFIEGIQGTGKSTLLEKLAGRHPDYHVYREGDYCPIELSWCTWMTAADYETVCRKYPSLKKELETQTTKEGDHYITAYTRILTDIPGFHQDMERWEIYNGRKTPEEFQRILLKRYENLPTDNPGNLYECSFFQNIVEEFLLYQQLSEEEIFAFYERLFALVKDKGFHLYYLYAEDLEPVLKQIIKERCDTQGNPLWYPLMLEYLKASPWGKKHQAEGFSDLLGHLQYRQDLELRLIKEILKDQGEILNRDSLPRQFSV